ncbi:MAG: YbhB/YbcL family Raf kinase inhibitor-like protein [Gemmatimonadales bacterium]
MATWSRLAKGTFVGAVLLCVGATPPVRAQVAFSLSSPDVHPGARFASAQVYNGMGCTGGNVSPALVWRGAPAATRSFAVTIYDPDAPTGSGWWHWVVFNIPRTVSSLPTGAGDPAKKLLPAGSTQGKTDFGTAAYGGPCPPAGDKPHHYIITVYALNVDKIEVPSGATAANVGFNIHAHTIDKATFTALYGR